METFDLVCTLAVAACTTVEAESLEAAIEIAKERDVWVEPGEENIEWVAAEIHGTTPEEIRRLGQDRAPVEMPIVHVDGTGAERLLESYKYAISAIEVALRELPVPSERDYQPRGAGSFERAQEGHQRRVAALQGVRDDLHAVLESITNQRDAAAR